MMDKKKQKLLRGGRYFRNLPIRDWDAPNILWNKKLCTLMEEYLTGGEQKTLEDIAEDNMDLKTGS